MIALHRLGHRHEPFLLNPDLIAKVEAHPDTVITLTTACALLVDETPAEVDRRDPCLARRDPVRRLASP